MTTRILLPEALADPCNRKCNRCASGGEDAASCTGPPVPPDGPPEARASEIRAQWVNLPLPRCERCEFLLLVQAIEHLIPAEELPDWLEGPNLDLGGRRPLECIEAGDYNPVFTALFLLDPCGPVS